MSKPWVLVTMLLLIVFTSQFEWNQQKSGIQIEAATSRISQQRQHITQRREEVKEQIILSQEKNIRKLTELVQNLQHQLQRCKAKNSDVNNTTRIRLAERLTEFE